VRAAVAEDPVEIALTRIGAAFSVNRSVCTGAETWLPGQRSNATTALTTASIKIDAASSTPVVPRLAM
jgi:hypothetical protein